MNAPLGHLIYLFLYMLVTVISGLAVATDGRDGFPWTAGQAWWMAVFWPVTVAAAMIYLLWFGLRHSIRLAREGWHDTFGKPMPKPQDEPMDPAIAKEIEELLR